MKSYSRFIQESLEARNKLIDFEAIIKDALKGFAGSKPTDKHIKAIADYMKGQKTFSVNKMSDYFYEKDPSVKDGWLKAAITAVKKEIDASGFGKNGGASKTLSRAERVDRYLKQKPTPRR